MSSKIIASTTSGTALNMSADTSGVLEIQTGSSPTTAITVDASQNVGIGTSSPACKLDINKGSAGLLANFTDGVNANFQIETASSIATIGPSAGSTNMAFKTSNTERMRIDSSGNFCLNTTAFANTNTNSVLLGTVGLILASHASGTASSTQYAAWNYNGANIGSITQAGTTGVLYNVTSDYRLKNDVAPIQNALDTVEALNPVSFTWADGRPDDGFLAHELQSVIPNCVTGEKDAIDEDGKPIYQQMDNSGVIPFLVKAIQELNDKVNAQAAEIKALKGVA